MCEKPKNQRLQRWLERDLSRWLPAAALARLLQQPWQCLTVRSPSSAAQQRLRPGPRRPAALAAHQGMSLRSTARLSASWKSGSSLYSILASCLPPAAALEPPCSRQQHTEQGNAVSAACQSAADTCPAPPRGGGQHSAVTGWELPPCHPRSPPGDSTLSSTCGDLYRALECVGLTVPAGSVGTQAPSFHTQRTVIRG